MKISGIVAMTPNRLIGRNGKLPWHIPEDLKLFKSVTLGSTVVMGRKTYESRNKALTGRRNVVLTKDKTWWVDDAIVINHPFQLVGVVDLYDDVFIIGGSDIYSFYLPYISELHVSTIFTDIKEEPGDIFFPEFYDYFDYYKSIDIYDSFEYGIYYKDDKQRALIPINQPAPLLICNTSKKVPQYQQDIVANKLGTLVEY